MKAALNTIWIQRSAHNDPVFFYIIYVMRIWSWHKMQDIFSSWMCSSRNVQRELLALFKSQRPCVMSPFTVTVMTGLSCYFSDTSVSPSSFFLEITLLLFTFFNPPHAYYHQFLPSACKVSAYCSSMILFCILDKNIPPYPVFLFSPNGILCTYFLYSKISGLTSKTLTWKNTC